MLTTSQYKAEKQTDRKDVQIVSRETIFLVDFGSRPSREKDERIFPIKEFDFIFNSNFSQTEVGQLQKGTLLAITFWDDDVDRLKVEVEHTFVVKVIQSTGYLL